MTTFLSHPNTDGLVKLTGTIRNLRVTRASASFFFTSKDQAGLGVIAVAAGIAGMGGQAIASASNAAALEEEADYLKFELDGKNVAAWVWRNPFRAGDVVSVAAQQVADHWEGYGIARDVDRTIALYPHCSRGSTRHYGNAFRWWLLGGGGFLLFIQIPLGLAVIGSEMFKEVELYWTLLGLMFFLAL